VLVGEIGLGDDDAVGEDDLPSRFCKAVDYVDAILRSDDGDDGLDMKFAAERPVGRKGGENGRRVGKPAGLYHDAPEMRDDAALAVRDQAMQRHRKIGTDIAA